MNFALTNEWLKESELSGIKINYSQGKSVLLHLERSQSADLLQLSVNFSLFHIRNLNILTERLAEETDKVAEIEANSRKLAAEIDELRG
jgi:hypothetical protein